MKDKIKWYKILFYSYIIYIWGVNMISIKDNIKEFKGLSETDIKYKILESMHHKDESTYINLGILFEYIWKDSNPMERKQMIKIIKNNL